MTHITLGVVINIIYPKKSASVGSSEEKLFYSLICNNMMLRNYTLNNRHFIKDTTYDNVLKDVKEVITEVTKFFPDAKNKIKSIYIIHFNEPSDIKDQILGS